jgi:hypothetical protein
MAEEIDGIWDKGPEDTKQLMYRHCWRPFWNVPETCLFHWWGFFYCGTIKLCIFIVMFIYSYCYVCSVLYILFSSCQLALFGYPEWGFSVLFPQLYGKCQGITRCKDWAWPALLPNRR